MRHHPNNSRRVQFSTRTNTTIFLNFRGGGPQHNTKLVLRGNRALQLRTIHPRRDRRLNRALKPVTRKGLSTILRRTRATNTSVLRNTIHLITNRNTTHVSTLQPNNGVKQITNTSVRLTLPFPRNTRINRVENSIPSTLHNRDLLWRHANLKLRFRNNTKTTVTPIIPLGTRSTTTKTRIYHLLTTPQLTRTNRRGHIQTRPISNKTKCFYFVVRGLNEVFRAPNQGPPAGCYIPGSRGGVRREGTTSPPNESTTFSTLFTHCLLGVVRQ